MAAPGDVRDPQRLRARHLDARGAAPRAPGAPPGLGARHVPGHGRRDRRDDRFAVVAVAEGHHVGRARRLELAESRRTRPCPQAIVGPCLGLGARARPQHEVEVAVAVEVRGRGHRGCERHGKHLPLPCHGLLGRRTAEVPEDAGLAPAGEHEVEVAVVVEVRDRREVVLRDQRTVELVRLPASVGHPAAPPGMKTRADRQVAADRRREGHVDAAVVVEVAPEHAPATQAHGRLRVHGPRAVGARPDDAALDDALLGPVERRHEIERAVAVEVRGRLQVVQRERRGRPPPGRERRRGTEGGTDRCRGRGAARDDGLAQRAHARVLELGEVAPRVVGLAAELREHRLGLGVLALAREHALHPEVGAPQVRVELRRTRVRRARELGLAEQLAALADVEVRVRVRWHPFDRATEPGERLRGIAHVEPCEPLAVRGTRVIGPLTEDRVEQPERALLRALGGLVEHRDRPSDPRLVARRRALRRAGERTLGLGELERTHEPDAAVDVRRDVRGRHRPATRGPGRGRPRRVRGTIAPEDPRRERDPRRRRAPRAPPVRPADQCGISFTALRFHAGTRTTMGPAPVISHWQLRRLVRLIPGASSTRSSSASVASDSESMPCST